MYIVHIILLVVFILIIGICAYIGTKRGFFLTINSFLRVALPMLLSGIIVFIASLISKDRMGPISYIIGFIGTIIFSLVMRSVIRDGRASGTGGSAGGSAGGNAGIVDYFLGFILGILQGWLIAGFLIVYINYFENNLINYHPDLQEVLLKIIKSPELFQAIRTPIDWLLFLSFIK